MASEDEAYSYYDGSRYFVDLAERIKLPIDQVNFITSQIVCVGLALVMRYGIHPRHTSVETRHFFSIVSGVAVIYFCHGRESIHLAVLSTICYLILRFTSPVIYHYVVLGVAMVYLSCVQLLRIRNCYGCFVLDITGPLMLLTQKMSSLAFSLHDGMTRDEKDLTPEQKKLVMRQFPSPLEYFSYMYHFQTILCGPLTFYHDYLTFIKGRQYRQAVDESGLVLLQGPEVEEPPYVYTVLKKLLGALSFGVFFLTIGPWYPVRRMREDDFVLNTTFLQKTWLLIVITSVARFKYYHAWLAADAVSNLSGLGFNGYDVLAQPKWDLISNVNIPNFELASSLRSSMENWNKGTMRWLRYVVYERVPYQKTLTTYMLSALWHGFYPGYYFCFGTAALVTIAARTVRRCFRYRFQDTLVKFVTYEFITFFATKVAVAYIVFPFLLLELHASVRLYMHLYFYLHILCLFAIFLLPWFVSAEHERQSESTLNASRQSNSSASSRKSNVSSVTSSSSHSMATTSYESTTSSSQLMFCSSLHSLSTNGKVVANGKDKSL